MILIGGDSWACGEWTRDSTQKSIPHQGLSQYIKESGKPSLNLGLPGASNLSVAHKINAWLVRNYDQKIDRILLFQTDYGRDFPMAFQEDYDRIQHANVLADIMVARYYYRLVEIATQHNVKIYLVGGLSDTLSPELIKSRYAPLEVACQSMVNLLINDDHHIKSPVLSLYGRDHIPMIEKIKKNLPEDQLPNLLKEIDRGLERESQIFSCPNLFWPDGYHPNRWGHKKLYDFLSDQGLTS